MKKITLQFISSQLAEGIASLRICLFACLLFPNIHVNAQKVSYPSSSYGLGTSISFARNSVSEFSLAGHYEINYKSWISLRHTIHLEQGLLPRLNYKYFHINYNPTLLFRITGDNGLYLSAGAHVRLINFFGFPKEPFNEKTKFFHGQSLTAGPAFSIGGRMRKDRRDFGAIELMILTNPLPIIVRMASPVNQVSVQINYLFPLKFK